MKRRYILIACLSVALGIEDVTAADFALNHRTEGVASISHEPVKTDTTSAYHPAINHRKALTSLPGDRQSLIAGVLHDKNVGHEDSHSVAQAATQMGLLNAPDIEATQELIFSGVKGTTSTAQKIIVKNTGDKSLTVNSMSFKGSHPSAFKLVNPPATPFSIAPQQSKEIKVAFAPGSLTGALSAALQINNNDPQEGKTQVGLYGLSAKGEQGNNEPPLDQIVKTLGYPINVGGTHLILGTGSAPIGDEVLVPMFQKAAAGPVTIKPVARYSPDALLPFGYYTLSNTKPVHHQVAVIDIHQEQQLNPAIVSGGKDKFDPGNAVFGFYVGETSYALYNNYTQNHLNVGPTKHAARIYPLKDRKQQPIAHSYLVAFEPASNGDYQDYVFVVNNVKPAGEPNPGTLISKVSVANGNTYQITTLAVNKTYYTDRAYTITSLPESLKGAAAIKTANADKANTHPSLVSFTLSKTATVFVAYDPRSSSLPAWLKGWTKRSGKVGVSDTGINSLALYSKVFPSGTVTLGGNLASPAAGAKTNYIIAATATQAGNTAYEAEDAFLHGAIKASNQSGFSGSGFVDYVHLTNDYIQWKVNSATAGEATLTIRYANGATGNRPMLLAVNGKTVDSSVDFPPTGSWSKWSVVNIATALLAGDNTVKLLANGASGPNVDYLSVTYPNNQRTAEEKGIQSTTVSSETNPIAEKTVDIYPNPVSSELIIQYQSATVEKIHMILTDSYARPVKDITIWVQQGRNQIRLPVSDMKNGLYVLSLVSEDQRIHRKIIITR